jgi:hypothetical protein
MLRWRTGGRGEEEEEDARTISSVSVQGWTRGTAAVQSASGEVGSRYSRFFPQLCESLCTASTVRLG